MALSGGVGGAPLAGNGILEVAAVQGPVVNTGTITADGGAGLAADGIGADGAGGSTSGIGGAGGYVVLLGHRTGVTNTASAIGVDGGAATTTGAWGAVFVDGANVTDAW